MKTLILKGLNEEQQVEMRQEYIHAVHLRQQLKKLLNEKIDASNKTVRSKDAYGIANWSFLAADAVGYERAMLEVISLLTNESQQETEVPKGAEVLAAVKKRGRPKVVRTSE